VLLPADPLPSSDIDERDVHPPGSYPHLDCDGLLQPEHLHDDPQAPEMQIGPVEEDFFDSQEEDFYYDDYNDDDEEEREVWEDGEEVHLQVPPELWHAPDRRGKKRMRMQRRPCQTSDADVSASAASLFASPVHSPLQTFQEYFQQRTGARTEDRETANCSEHGFGGASYGEGLYYKSTTST
jgi:hypothetical protein